MRKIQACFFSGVTTVVTKLFNIVMPDIAVFGQKDYQQLQIIRQLVLDLNYNIKIVAGDIIREKDGLAMSSRNKRLKKDQLHEATLIYKTLSEVQQKFDQHSISELNDLVENRFTNHPILNLEYFEIADVKTLKTAMIKRENTTYRAFIAVFVDGVRLIDNIALN